MKIDKEIHICWFIVLMVCTLVATFTVSWLGIGIAMFVTTTYMVGSRELTLWLLGIVITCAIGMAHLWWAYKFNIVANVFEAGAVVVGIGLGTPVGLGVQREIRRRGLS